MTTGDQGPEDFYTKVPRYSMYLASKALEDRLVIMYPAIASTWLARPLRLAPGHQFTEVPGLHICPSQSLTRRCSAYV